MGLAELVSGLKGSPMQEFLGNALTDLGYGLTTGTDFGQALGAATQRTAQMAPLRLQEQEKRKADALTASQTNATKAWLQANYPQYANLPPAEGFELAMKLEQQKYTGASGPTSDIQNYEYGIEHPGFVDFQTQKGGTAETSLQPTWGVDNDPASPTFGQTVLGQLNKAGKFVQTELPPGVAAMDPRTLAGERAAGTGDAKTAVAARAALPGAKQQLDVTNKALDLVVSDDKGLNEQFGTILGVPQRSLPAYPGSSLGNWQANFSQVKGQAFLQARQFLKGQGAITEMESAKAEGAYSRMEAAAASGDKGTFLSAAQDFRDAVQAGYDKLAVQAQGGGGPTLQGNSGGNQTSTGVTWSVDP